MARLLCQIANITVHYQIEENKTEIYPHMFRYNAISEREVLWGDWLDNKVHISDIEGKLKDTISLRFDRKKINESDKETIIKRMFGDDRIDKKIVFPKYFPNYYSFLIGDNIIYLFSFERGTPSGHFYYLLNLKGKSVNKIFFNPDRSCQLMFATSGPS